MSAAPIRLALIIDDATVGGGQRHVRDLAAGLDPARFEVAVITEPRGWLVDELAGLALTLAPVHLGNRPDPRALSAVSRHLRALRPHVVHTHGGTAGFYGRVAARPLRARTVHTYHGLHALRGRGPRARVFRLLDQVLARRTDRLVCVSAADLALAMRHGLAPAGRSLSVPNGIDAAAYAPAIARRVERRESARAAANGGADEPASPDRTSARPGPAGRGLVIGTVGRLSAEKGHRDFLEAAARVHPRLPGARFVVIGEGAERAALESRRLELGLDDVFELPGARYDLPTALGGFDLFVLPSHWEGHPIAMLEAMAAGLPVIASEIDGTRAIAGEGAASGGTPCAVLVPPRDPAALAEAIVDLSGDETRRDALAVAGLARVRSQFEVHVTVAALAAVYEELARF